MQQEFYAHGKLLISGEYLVLKGALALAIPTRKGQHMRVSTDDAGDPVIHWQSLTHDGRVWMDVVLDKSALQVKELRAGEKSEVDTLLRTLHHVRTTQAHYLAAPGTTTVINQLEFPRDWGLGSSSTLISNVAKHARVDPFALQAAIFGGSGYDIACARAALPVLYKLDDEGYVYDSVNFMPPVPEQLCFVHLNTKQNSKVAVEKFLAETQGKNLAEPIEVISEISEALLFCDDAADFIQLLDEHEEMMQYVLQEEKVKARLFPDFPGSVKSLGAWGGDFVLAAADMEQTELKKYFTDKGFDTVIEYLEMT